VVVGKDRRATGTLAVRQFHPDLSVLDDGLQYWQLHRDLDIVLLNACDPFDNGWTFPRGLLREPPRHLARAGIVVLTHTSRAGKEQVAEVIASVRRLAPDRPIFTANLTPYGLRSLMDQSTFPIDWLEGRRVAAVSALGNPDGFEAMIGDLGGVVAARFRYRDHQAITVAELDAICEEAGRGDAEALITTEKDAVKMAPLRNRLPILALQVRMQVDDERRFLRAVAEAREGYVT
jgi:tetraacyldisaccharide 4'-kinase